MPPPRGKAWALPRQCVTYRQTKIYTPWGVRGGEAAGMTGKIPKNEGEKLSERTIAYRLLLWYHTVIQVDTVYSTKIGSLPSKKEENPVWLTVRQCGDLS